MSGANFWLFLAAALLIAAIPGPAILYVAARTLSGGRKAGIASAFGTALGGLFHVIGGGLGVSAIILAFQIIYSAFFVSVLDIRMSRTAPEAALSPAARVA